jgi:hypothetical protein
MSVPATVRHWVAVRREFVVDVGKRTGCAAVAVIEAAGDRALAVAVRRSVDIGFQPTGGRARMPASRNIDS